MAEQFDLRKIEWRCRRGTKELDVILQGFVKKYYSSLSDEEKKGFAQLLDIEDPQLTDWLCYQSEPLENKFNQGVVKIVKKILSTHKS